VRKVGLEDGPLGIGQIAGIGFGVSSPFYVRIRIMEQTVSALADRNRVGAHDAEALTRGRISWVVRTTSTGPRQFPGCRSSRSRYYVQGHYWKTPGGAS
jgi:hypothetical protein